MSDSHTIELQRPNERLNSGVSQREQLEERLARFVMTGRVLWQFWHQAPQQEVLKELNVFFDEWPLGAERADVRDGLGLMRSGATADIQTLKLDYADLFVGPDRLKAAPWGSVYLAEEQTTFGESTLAVRAFYRQHGMAIETGEHEPDDHIGLMFAFIAWVGEQGLDIDVDIDADEPLQPAFCALRTFLEEHVLTWVPRLCELVQKDATTDLYKGLGMITSGALSAMAEILEAKPEAVKLYR